MLTNFKKSEGEQQKTNPVPQPHTSASSSLASTPSNTGPRVADRGAPSVIGPDLTINGNLSSNGQVQIDGEIQGDIRGTHIIVGESARITGNIIADEVVVRGKVMGSVRGKRVMLQANSHLEGDVFHKALAIEQGAFFEGKSRRADDPVGTSDPVETPPMANRITPDATPSS